MDDANRIFCLSAYLNEQVRLGKRVECRIDFAAVIVAGRPVRHALHLAVTIVTLGLLGLAGADPRGGEGAGGG